MSYEALINQIAQRIIKGRDTDWAMNIHSFDWVPGVGLYGIYTAYKKTHNKEYLDFLISWTDRHLKEAYDKTTVNSTAPLLTVLELYTETHNENYIKVCTDIAEYILNQAPKTREGGLEHTVTEAGSKFSEQIWADTLFMVCIFLVKLGSVTHNRSYTDFALRQLVLHHKLLFDPDTGLYFHGWNCALQNHMSGVHWARANAWIIYSSMEILETVPEFDGADEIKGYIKIHADALRTLQRPNGTFGTILDDSDSYDELSATAGITAGIKHAVNYGILDDSFESMVQAGIKALSNAVLEDGTVDKVSSGTPIMKDAAAYKSIGICPTLYGQGLALIALSCI